MKKFNEEKIIKVLQEAESNIIVRDVRRIYQITERTFYRWWNKFGSMTELEHDNALLNQMVADLTLGNRILRDVNQGKW